MFINIRQRFPIWRWFFAYMALKSNGIFIIMFFSQGNKKARWALKNASNKKKFYMILVILHNLCAV